MEGSKKESEAPESTNALMEMGGWLGTESSTRRAKWQGVRMRLRRGEHHGLEQREHSHITREMGRQVMLCVSEVHELLGTRVATFLTSISTKR